MTKPKPKLTREALHQAVLPPNNCRVKAFRDSLQPEERDVLDEALGYPRRDLPASALRNMLLTAGFEEMDVPGIDAINAHRSGVRPCRCSG